jgi:predicted TIM-barrel fold metal-dependent hydrolase
MNLDEVCLFFPELTVIMANGADPWWDAAIRLMSKYPRLYLMTSAFAPKYLPQSVIRFMAGRGRAKVMFASDFPFLAMNRCTAEARELGLHAGALDDYLQGNAERVLFRRSESATAQQPSGDALDH